MMLDTSVPSHSHPDEEVEAEPESRIELNALKNVDQIKEAFSLLSKEEESVDADLEKLLSQQIHLEQRLRNLSLMAPEILKAHSDSVGLSKLISFTANLAEGVSVKVKQLDLAKSRVSECQQRVNDLIDLKLCSDGVQTALQEEDYEQAAAHLHRFLAMDEGLLQLTASEMQEDSLDGGGSNLDGALKTLHQAEGTVKEIVAQKFDEAVKLEDLASIERFFKIFPLINMHDEGLKKFTQYLCSKLEEASKNNLRQAIETPPGDPRASVIFADTLTLLFEGIARTVEIHQPLIETYYGPGRLLTVLSRIQEECNRQTDKVLAEFRKKRDVKDKTVRVREAMYSSSSHHGSGSSSHLDQKKITAKDLDHVLSEMTLLEARAEMYYKFVRKRVTNDLEVSTSDSDIRARALLDLERLMTQSGLFYSMQDLLAEYILLEDYFMSENVAKAITEDRDGGQNLLDDVFFILKKCITRAISGQNVDGVCAVVNNACGILEQDFCGLLQTQLKMGFPTGYLDLTQAYNVLQTSFQQGKLQGGDSEKQKTIFLNALNNSDSASDYINRLTNSLENEVSGLLQSRNSKEKDKIDNCLTGFPSVTSKLKTLLDQGMQQLRQSAVKPRIKPWMDTFVSHDIGEDEFSDYEANDPFVQNLIRNLDGLLAGFKKSLSEKNYDSLVSILTSEVTAQLEKAVLKSSFSRLGGLMLDREIRSLVSFLTSVTTWTIRDKFSRLTQIATILNLESVFEMSDIWGSNSGGVNWKLTPVEVRQVMCLRTDFPLDEVKRLRL